MNTKSIIIVVLIAATAIGLMAWGYGNMAGPTQARLNEPGSLKATETLYDFGTISMANGKVSHLFQITNPTDKDITIGNLQTSCMCTVAYIVDGESKEGPFGMPGMGGMTATNHIVPAHCMRGIEVVFD